MSFPDPIAVFRTEAAELLEQIEAGLLDLNVNLGDKDQVDAVFRGLHTLKGSGAMFGFEALAAFTHHCETAFDRVRKGEVPATHALVTAVLEAKDHMRALVETPAGDHEAVSEVLLANLRHAVDGSGDPAAASVSAAPAKTLFKIRFSLPQNAMANGTNPLPLLDELRDLGTCRIVADRSGIPALDELVPTDLHVSWDVELLTDQPRSAIDDVFIFVMDDMELAVEEIAVAAQTPTVAAPAPVAAAAPVAAEPVASAPPTAAATTAPPPGDAKAAKANENVRVPAEKLDELMDRVGELVIAQSRLSQLAGGSGDLTLRAVSEDVERLSGELRDTMMVLRMVPVTHLFSRFRRLVHDLANETGKRIELVTEGETTEVDKSVIERLADPLVHLVRNSCDHGLETPEDRLAAGKTEAGHIHLSARQQAGEVIITIKDDGRGINKERVRAKAESSGLIAANASLSDQELYQLIFQPGFSTASQVTNLSGRGVGMDVVKRTIDALRGTINVVSRPGEGSEISLAIPLTLAIIDGLLVRVGNGRYVIPLSAVEECLELSIEEDMRSRGRSFISLRDSLVPFLRLRDLFRTNTTPDPFQKVVVISTGSERVGLVVDQIIGDHQTVIKGMSKLHHDVATFSGATILGDGDVALILDVGHLVAEGQQQEAHLRAAG
ncbi:MULTISPECIES: chemotaxis protein CheA [Rhizobiaceae]|jgi:two-component system chemotaxis sensor kinase CheA|uniref:Chemotaxis protein CheA n=1 Tax=Aliirhizobium cellulosilyticum TaxID=393664 RepID=A0A7W6Y4T0_9HYPH|nr:chemotaxis protein CheA [Rhizobium cellulosilyticum]MBB4349192.1 two-component system chemotaxis sensor kinase CheA [Rhizobium cellulosilyticum]MBB4412587.1 two-component system chemotaxis sensor kinase CheA [Rhizobium cellulosilyticum]MBB4447219.1 two-component system chemotaxis sensor kinase CheA [Rhizobium cellulosilyticum]